MEQILQSIALDPYAGKLLAAMVALSLLDFVLGSIRALVGGTFSLDSFATWGRAHLLSHIVPNGLVLVFGSYVGDLQFGDFNLNILYVTAEVHAVSYIVTVGKSIMDSLNTKTPDEVPAPATQ